jgi:hypothetical protein
VRDIVALSLGRSGVVALLSAHGIALGPDKILGIALALASASGLSNARRVSTPHVVIALTHHKAGSRRA